MRRVEDAIGLLWVLSLSVLAASLAGPIEVGRAGLSLLWLTDLLFAGFAIIATYALRGEGFLDPAQLSVRDVAPFVASVLIALVARGHKTSLAADTPRDGQCTLFFDHASRSEVLSGHACLAANIALDRASLGAALAPLAVAWAYSRLTRRTARRYAGPPPGSG